MKDPDKIYTIKIDFKGTAKEITVKLQDLLELACDIQYNKYDFPLDSEGLIEISGDGYQINQVEKGLFGKTGNDPGQWLYNKGC